MYEEDNKTVIVEVTLDNQRKSEYELTFKSREDICDVDILESRLKLKWKEILYFIQNDGVCDFAQESKMFKGRWSSVGENSPIKHLSFWKFQIGQRRKLQQFHQKPSQKPTMTLLFLTSFLVRVHIPMYHFN